MAERNAPPDGILDEHREDLADTALALLGFDTQNPPGETDAIVGWIEEYLDELGLATERIAIDPVKPNVLARLPGKREETVLFSGHLDTVPFDAAEWSKDPLGERDGDRVYGRGATDMKSQVAAMLHVARLFVRTETVPPVDLAFLFVSDEEIGGPAGLQAVLEETTLDVDACVIGEMTCTDSRCAITVADRGSIWLTLEAAGTAAHGSRPMLGENAIDRLYEAVTALRTTLDGRELPVDGPVRPILEESIAYYEPMLGRAVAEELFDHPTINLGTIEGGEAINVVPHQATAEIDVRISPGVETSSVLADIRACLDACTGVTLADVSWRVGTYEPVESPLVAAMTDAVRTVTGQRVYRRSATGGGDTKTLRDAGIPAIEFALGTETVHGVDEYTTVDAMVANATIYAQLPFEFDQRV